jgi:hypothetical protein
LVGAEDDLAELALAAVGRRLAQPKANLERGQVVVRIVGIPRVSSERADLPVPALFGGARRLTSRADTTAAGQVDRASSERDENQPVSHDAGLNHSNPAPATNDESRLFFSWLSSFWVGFGANVLVPFRQLRLCE